MIYREIELPAPARRFAFCGWQFVMEPSDPPAVQHQVPPDGTVNLLLTRIPDGSLYPMLVGPSLAATSVPVAQGFAYCGLRLRPEAAQAVIGRCLAPGAAEPDRLEGPLAPIWGDLIALESGGSDWRASAALFGNLGGTDPVAAAAVDRIVADGGRVGVAELAVEGGLSERQFRRRFLAACGISAKQYADVQRVRRALILSLVDADWAGIAHDSGFADQPHLARDVKERFGAGPRRVQGYLGTIRHELLEPDHVRFLQDVPAVAA